MMRRWIDTVAEMPMLAEEAAPSSTITDVIKDEIAKTGGMSPRRINDGWCYEFAAWVKKRVGGDIIESDVHLDPSLPVHCFIRYGGRYYDAENPRGVDDWHDLKYFRRMLKDR